MQAKPKAPFETGSFKGRGGGYFKECLASLPVFLFLISDTGFTGEAQEDLKSHREMPTGGRPHVPLQKKKKKREEETWIFIFLF